MGRWLVLGVSMLIAAGCGSSEPEAVVIGAVSEASEVEITAVPTTPKADGDGLYPTVLAAVATSSDGDSWQIDVTMLSEYDSPSRYADAWRVLDNDDTELGIRVLTHDHAGEQPFTRSAVVDLPPDVSTVFVEGRDQLNGWSGQRFVLSIKAG